MADYVRVPETDWQDILDAVRGKTGRTEKMLSGVVAEAIETGGGGGLSLPFITVEEMTATASTTTALETANYISSIGNAEVSRFDIGYMAVIAKETPNENTVNNSLIYFGGMFSGGKYTNVPHNFVRWRDGSYNTAAPPTASSYDVRVNPGDEFYKIFVTYRPVE